MKAPILRVSAAGASAQEFRLQAGANTFGRNETNLHVINLPSVSSWHCEAVWEGDTIRVRDLGSTNGTFIDGQRIEEGLLGPGQTLRLGAVDLVLEGLEPPPAPSDPPLAPRLVPMAATAEPALAAPRPAVRLAPALASPFVPPRSFLQCLPGTFAYPLSKNGVFLVLGGTVFYTVLDFCLSLVARRSVLGLVISLVIFVSGTGYLFAYMQKIIASSAQGEEELPDWPEFGEWWSDIVRPFLLLVWTCVFCFGPAWAVFNFGDKTNPLVTGGALALLVGGGLYFPMALLAVAATDNFLAVNPLVVLLSIFRVFGPYVVACIVLVLLVALRVGNQWALGLIPVPFLPSLLLEFISLYLLCVEMRILGLLFYTNRQRLGWFS